MATSKIRIVKIRERCGMEFLAQKQSTRFCSHQCSRMAYKDAKRLERKRNTEARVRTHVQEIVQSEIGDKELLTFREAAALLGITKQAMYALVARGSIIAYKITSRLSRIRKTDIDKMLESNPYIAVDNVDAYSDSSCSRIACEVSRLKSRRSYRSPEHIGQLQGCPVVRYT